MTSNLQTVLNSKLLAMNLQFFVEKKPNAPGIKPMDTMSVWDVYEFTVHINHLSVMA